MNRMTIAVSAALLWSASASAQEDQVVRIQTNETKKIGMSKNQNIAKAQNENPNACVISSVTGDPRSIFVTGVAPGQSRINFTSADNQLETIAVRVQDYPAPALAPGQVEISFLDGSIIRLALQVDKIDIETAYGKLSVATKDLRAIEFGLRIPNDTAKQIAQAVKNLREKNFRERDQAAKTLASLGPWSYAAAVEASNSDDLEVSRRAKAVVDQLYERHPRSDLKTPGPDRLVTADATLSGRILNMTFRAKSSLFGESDLPLAQMRSLRGAAAK